MRKIISLALLALFLTPSLTFAAAVPESENFDGVTVPALPSGWTSSSLVGGQNAVTSAVSADSAPNAAFIPAPGFATSTALNTKPYTFTTGLASYGVSISFRHRRGFELNFDGGVFEVSLNGAPFVDVTSPSIGGTFSAGAYNSAGNLIGGGSLAGRKAWTGVSAVFESVNIRIPAIPDNTTVQFRFFAGTDTSIGSSGWFIDTVRITPDTNLVSSATPLLPEVAPGSNIPVDIAVSNPSSLEANVGALYISSPVSLIKSLALTKSGFLQRFGKWMWILSLVDLTSPLSTDAFPMVIQDIPGRSAAKLTFLSSSDSGFVGASAPVAFLSSSPPINGGSLTGEVIFGSINPCSPPAPVLPAPETGRIVIYPAPVTCPIGQAALAYQALGATAFIVSAPSPIVPPPPGDYPSPFVSEAATPGLTIPTFTHDIIAFPALFAAVGAPGTSSAALQGFNGSELRTIAVGVTNFGGGDPKFGDNLVTSLINVVTDVDADGTPDIRDGCKADPAKVSPGACGCGIIDADSNANGVFDCFPSADFKAQVAKLQSLLKKFSLKSKQYKTQKTQLTNLRKAVAAFGVNSAGLVSVSAAGIDIVKLTKKADKAVAAAIKARTSTSLATAKKAAAKELAKLLKGIA